MNKRINLYVMAAFYTFAGLMHFLRPAFYLQMMPPWFPWHLALVQISGVAEIAIGIGLVIPRTSRAAAWGAIALLIAVFPANLYMWTHHVPIDGHPVPGWFHAVRLPAQGLLIVCVFWLRRPPRS